MGWAHCVNTEGRACGYGVTATCDLDNCDAQIDRGLAYCCGNMHDGGEYGCGRYFCGSHLFFTEHGQLCGECSDKYPDEEEDE